MQQLGMIGYCVLALATHSRSNLDTFGGNFIFFRGVFPFLSQSLRKLGT